MSLATAPVEIGSASLTRAAICDALREIGELSVHSTAPDTPVAWDAFPRWALSNYRGGRLAWLAVHEYDALVILPAGYEPDTVEQGDSLLDRVAYALSTVGVVQTAEPIQIQFNSGTAMPALRVRIVPHINARH
jgi:hypothetical protein